MGSDKKHKKDKSRKDKKDKKHKRRRYSSSDDSDREADKQVRRIEKEHHQRQGIPHNAAIDEEVVNAYGDSNLNQKFFWKKKVEKDVRHTRKESRPAVRNDASRNQDRMEELERVKAKRTQNEAEYVARQEDIGDLERRRLAADAIAEAAKEEQFHLKQNVDRARRRLDEGRAQAIDQLVRMLWLQDTHPSDASRDPYTIFEGMRIGELKDLVEEIEIFKALDVELEGHQAYWQSLYDLMKWKEQDALLAEEADEEAIRTGIHVSAVHASANADVEAIFTGQSYKELTDLDSQLEIDLASGACNDPDFWLAVQGRLGVFKARTRVREVYRSKVSAALKQFNDAEAHEVGSHLTGVSRFGSAPGEGPPSKSGEDISESAGASGSRRDRADPSEARDERSVSPSPHESENDSEDDSAVPAPWLALSDGRFSPRPLPQQLVSGQEVIHEDEDRETLMLMRQQVKLEGVGGLMGRQGQGTSESGAAASEADRATEVVVRRAMAVMGSNDDEVAFSAEVPIESQEYWWQAKYKPRKPKFFNRVHTGYDWNKYNRAHYDADNPPPKVVQGYKFNLFYPDLLNKAIAPTYKTMDDPTCTDGSTCLLLFSAGPPYEDVAFRIVNKDWEYGNKLGFKNVFERDVLHLYFNFKRNPYRR